jgi:glutaminase
VQQLTRRGCAVLVAWSLAAIGLSAQKPIDPQTAVNNAFNQFRSLKEGKNADDIPALAKVDPDLFGIALVTVDGEVFTAGADDLYTRQCSIGVNAWDLATIAATLAAGGKNPVTGKSVMDANKVPGVLAVMATAGLYDDSGKWLYHTGLPAKSGVGGGLIAVSPGKFGIAVVSPPLDDAGNSVRAQRAIAAISNALGGNPWAPTAR